ncbi:MAG TPA: type II toxin-antitoxin system prevent-host-death family antitoxin [Acidimicrobiales bacterium]|jgi:prevent-host-death family protein|nr:type II toxin-antitoxin system prevent-host-death family antitoxin [Acidimicrobiales bacterium]
MDVAISDLRANLKAYIERAAAGERVVVTDRGVPVARLVAADHEELLDRLARDGVVTRAARPKSRASKRRRVRASGPVAELVSEMRSDRDARVLG